MLLPNRSPLFPDVEPAVTAFKRPGDVAPALAFRGCVEIYGLEDPAIGVDSLRVMRYGASAEVARERAVLSWNRLCAALTPAPSPSATDTPT